MFRKWLGQTTTRTRVDRRHRPHLDRLEDRTVPTAVLFYLDDVNSTLSLSGNILGVPFEQQGPGSLTATVAGIISADIDTAAGTFSWGTDSYAAAADSGSWQPLADGSAGSAPANYGVQVDFLGLARAAVRGAVVSAYTSEALALTDYGDGNYYYPSTQTLATLAGDAAYNHPLLGSGSRSIADQSGTNQAGEGYLYDFGDGTYYLEAPIVFSITVDISGITATLEISGLIYAYGYASDGPSPDSGSGSGSQALGFLATLEEMTPAIVTPTFTLADLAIQPVGQFQQSSPPAQGVDSSLLPEQVETGLVTLEAALIDSIFDAGF